MTDERERPTIKDKEKVQSPVSLILILIYIRMLIAVI